MKGSAKSKQLVTVEGYFAKLVTTRPHSWASKIRAYAFLSVLFYAQHQQLVERPVQERIPAFGGESRLSRSRIPGRQENAAIPPHHWREP